RRPDPLRTGPRHCFGLRCRMSDPETWSLDTRRLGRRVLVYESVDSTNNRAAALGNDPANDGLAVLADAQTAGRGQHGRSWLCAPRTGVLLSLLLFPPPPLRRPAVLTAWAAVSVCELILQAANLQARIKWPNDILLRGRKVCGILIEQSTGPGLDAAGRPQFRIVAGIGLNLNQTASELADAGLTEACSLATFTGQQFDNRALACALLARLDDEYDRLCAGDLATLEASWKWRLGLLDNQVTAECVGAVYRGRLHDLTFAGLELELPDGERLHLPAETVRQLRGDGHG